MKRVRRDIFRFGDPKLVALADATVSGTVRAKDAESLMRHIGDVGTVVLQRNQDVPKVEKQPTPADMPKHKDEAEHAGQDAEPRSESERHIVSENPMLAKAHEGRGYESKVAIERHWSDGSKDYKCVDCTYASPNRLAVRGHYQVHARKKGRAQGPSPQRSQTFKVEVPDAVRYKPRQSRIDALAAQIKEAMDQGQADPGEIARTALTWVHEQSKQGTNLAAEREDMSDGDVLNRIRNLLDDGSYMRQQEELATMRDRLVRAERETAAAREQAEQARSTLRAFTDLANELSQGDQESA